jgi:cyclase
VRNLPGTEHYAFETLGDGIHVGRARPEGTGLSNTGVIDLGGSTLVFDTSLTLRSAREIRENSITLTGRVPDLTANSHWHLDHMLGNQVFADGAIYASRRTIEILLEKRTELEGELSRERLAADIRDLERKREASTSGSGRTQYEAALRFNRALLEESLELKFTPPSKEFDGELRLPGRGDVRLRSFGAGHTDSDVILHSAEHRIVFAGDLVVSGTHPNLGSGDPGHWLTVLDRIEELRPERIVPGHGPVGSDETLGVMRDYLGAVLERADNTGSADMPERFRALGDPEDFATNVAYTRQWANRTHGTTEAR